MAGPIRPSEKTMVTKSTCSSVTSRCAELLKKIKESSERRFSGTDAEKCQKCLKDMLQNVVKRCPIKLCIVRTSELLMTGTNCLVTIPLACIPYFFESYKFLYVVPNTRTFHPEIVMANQTVITYPSLYSLFEMRIVVRKLMRNPIV